MIQPTRYDRRFNFTDWEANHPTAPVPGSALDMELNEIRTVLNALTIDTAELASHHQRLETLTTLLAGISDRLERIEEALRQEARL